MSIPRTCPNCQRGAILWSYEISKPADTWSRICMDCKTRGPHCKTRSGADAAWNKLPRKRRARA